MLLNVYIFHFAFWYEMIEKPCVSLTVLPWRENHGSIEWRVNVPELGQHWSIWSKILVTFSSHMWVLHKKWFEYITNMSGKNTIVFFIIEFDVFMWDSKKPQKMQILGFALPAKWVIRSSPFSCLVGLKLWEADPEHMCQLKMCCFKQILLSLKELIEQSLSNLLNQTDLFECW